MASQTMADYLKTGGWLVIVCWWLSPIISLLVNKFLAYLFSGVSRKFRNLETITLPDLKQALRNAQEQRMQRAVEGKGSRHDLMTLAKLEEHLKSAFYEAQDIMDTVEYHRIEKKATGHTSSWVQCRLLAARDSVAGFYRSCFCLGRWIDVTGAALLQCMLRPSYKLVRLFDRGFQQCSESLYWQLSRIFRGSTTSGAPLAVSLETSISRSGGTSSSTSPTVSQVIADAAGEPGGPKPPLLQPANKVVEVEEEKAKREIEEEKVEEEDEVEREKIEETYEEEQVKEEEEKGGLWRFVKQCFRSMLILSTNVIAFVRFCRDCPYEVVGIKCNQRGGIAVYSFFPTFGTNSLGKRIKHIENILGVSKNSDLLNRQSSSEIPVKDTNKESSSNKIPVKEDPKMESSSTHEQIDDLYVMIEQKIFGRDKELQHICGMLRKRQDAYRKASSSHSKPYYVLGIHGIAGSGKSALAYYICDHEKKAEDKHFDLIMFSHVSMTFRLDKIFHDMLRQIRKYRQYDSKDIVILHNEVMENLKGKRFLLVLDDVWFNYKNQKEWYTLLDALCNGQNGSVILVTAQRKDAAAALGAQEEEQMSIPDLEEEEYLKLFMHHALQGTVDDDSRFKRIGRSIAKKLHRSPIAAVAVGWRLRAEKSILYWEAAANFDVLNEIMGALWWSYQQLGVDTRRCFQYCSTFPKGYKLSRDELVHCWIAQGFVNTTSNATEELEDVGQRYLEELVNFSFLQVQRTIFGAERFTIHDLLHELAERVAGSDFFRIDDSIGLPKDIPPGVRHLFIESKNGAQVTEITEKNSDIENLRTLIIKEDYTYTKQRRYDLEKMFERLFTRLRKLRVLIITLGNDPEEFPLPASIDKMKHLHYFSFNYPNADTATLILPNTFSKLHQMQTIYFPSKLLVSYPEGMANLICLRHIFGCLGFPNVGRLTSLQAMDRFHVKKKQGYELKQLEKLNKLRGRLEIVGLENVGSKEEALEADLASKKQVMDLKLEFGYGSRTKNHPDKEAEVLEGLCPPKYLQVLTIEGYRGSSYPNWMLNEQQHPNAPKHLRKLVLRNCSCSLASFPEDSELSMHLLELEILLCEWDSLPENMERLMSLQRLTISGSPKQNKMMLVPTLPQSLQRIMICGCNFVLENMEHLVSLEILHIYRCNMMEHLPTLPQSLKKILISESDVLGRTCQEEGHENWQKIQHVPMKEICAVGNQSHDKATVIASIGDDRSVQTPVDASLLSLVSQGSSQVNTEQDRGKPQALTGQDMTTMVTPSSVHTESQEWILDSSAGIHHTSNPRVFLDSGDLQFQDTDKDMARDNDALCVLGRGSVRTAGFQVPAVCYVEGDTRNIFSVNQLSRDHGLATVFESTKCYVTDQATGQIVGQGRFHNDKYVLDSLLIAQDVNNASLFQKAQESSQAKAAEQDSSESQQPGRAGTADESKTAMGIPSTTMMQADDRDEWVLDTRASTHHTSNQRLLLGLNDGQLNIGHGLVQTERFHVPNVSYDVGDERNVISVAQLASSRSVVTIFDPTGCYMKDKKTRQIVGRGHLRDDGVYVLDNLFIAQDNDGGRGGCEEQEVDSLDDARGCRYEDGKNEWRRNQTGGKCEGGQAEDGTGGGKHDGGGGQAGGGGRDGDGGGDYKDNGQGIGGGDGDGGDDGGNGGGGGGEGEGEEQEDELKEEEEEERGEGREGEGREGEGEEQEDEQEEEERGGGDGGDYGGREGGTKVDGKEEVWYQKSSNAGLPTFNPYKSLCPCKMNELTILSGACRQCGIYDCTIVTEVSVLRNVNMPQQEGERPPPTLHFLMDSGAANHITWTRNGFLESSCDPPTPCVYGMGTASIKVEGYGDLKTGAITLEGVLLVPKGYVNLVSVGKLVTDFEMRVVFEEKMFFIQRLATRESIGYGRRMGNHYVLQGFEPERRDRRQVTNQPITSDQSGFTLESASNNTLNTTVDQTPAITLTTQLQSQQEEWPGNPLAEMPR